MFSLFHVEISDLPVFLFSAKSTVQMQSLKILERKGIHDMEKSQGRREDVVDRLTLERRGVSQPFFTIEGQEERVGRNGTNLKVKNGWKLEELMF